MGRLTVTIAVGLLLFDAAALAQISCRLSAGAVTVRAEGMAELLGDLVLTCTGGSPQRAGELLPQYEILVSSNAPLSGRLLTTGTRDTMAWTDSVLLIDDPPPHMQAGCSPAQHQVACLRAAGEPGPNVFQGRQLQSNLLVFQSIPVESPGRDATRTIRITNLRANIPQLLAESRTDEVRVSVQMLANGRPVPVEAAEAVVAKAASAMRFSVRTAVDGEVAATTPAFTVTPSMIPVGSAASSGPSLSVKFSERFASAFRRRNIGTTASDPAFVAPQSLPGVLYATESGLFNNALLTDTRLERAGLADTGTRLRVTLRDIPKNVTLWASIRDVAPGTTGHSATSARAVLTWADAAGAGALSPAKPTSPGFLQIPVSEGWATIVWEVVASDPDVLEDISFSLALTSEGVAPWLGTAWISGSMAPWFSSAAAGDVAPRFTGKPDEVRAFTISDTVRTQPISVVSGVSFAGTVAPDSIVSIFGSDFTAVEEAASAGVASVIGDTFVDIIDFGGARRRGLMYFVSPGQINLWLDPATRPGPAIVNVNRGTRLLATGSVQVDRVAPGLFSADRRGSGAALGEVFRIGSTAEDPKPLASWDEPKKEWVALPVDLGSSEDLVYLVLYGTGIRGRSNLQNVNLTIGDIPVPVLSAGQAPGIPGLDQVNAGPLPASLRGKGLLEAMLQVDQKQSNRVMVNIR